MRELRAVDLSSLPSPLDRNHPFFRPSVVGLAEVLKYSFRLGTLSPTNGYVAVTTGTRP